MKIRRTFLVTLLFRQKNLHLTDHTENQRNHIVLRRASKDYHFQNGIGQGHGQEVGQDHTHSKKATVGDQVCKKQ